MCTFSHEIFQKHTKIFQSAEIIRGVLITGEHSREGPMIGEVLHSFKFVSCHTIYKSIITFIHSNIYIYMHHNPRCTFHHLLIPLLSLFSLRSSLFSFSPLSSSFLYVFSLWTCFIHTCLACHQFQLRCLMSPPKVFFNIYLQFLCCYFSFPSLFLC